MHHKFTTFFLVQCSSLLYVLFHHVCIISTVFCTYPAPNSIPLIAPWCYIRIIVVYLYGILKEGVQGRASHFHLGKIYCDPNPGKKNIHKKEKSNKNGSLNNCYNKKATAMIFKGLLRMFMTKWQKKMVKITIQWQKWRQI